MNKKKYESEGLYRFRIIAPLINETFAHGELKKKLKELSKKFYEHPERGYEQFAYKTIQEWYYNYKNGGLSALEKNLRSDYGKSRSIPPEIGELIIIMKKENYARSAIQIIQELILAGKINKNEISRSSVYRLLCNHKKDIQQYKKEIKEKRRYAFEYC